MKFNRLNQSIANSWQQPPSIYMALCMVEALFEDIENECRCEISGCPVGDDCLSTKLVWLCRIINEIYEKNSDELQRNRSRLDAMMNAFRSTEKELSKFSDVTSQLAALQADYAQLERKLVDARETQKQYQILSDQYNQAQQTLKVLQAFDSEAAKAELLVVTEKIEKLEQSNKQWSVKLEEAERDAAVLERDAERLSVRHSACQEKISDLSKQISDHQSGIDATEKQIAALTLRHEETKAILEGLKHKQSTKSRELVELEKKCQHYRVEILAPILKQVEAHQQELVRLEQSKADTEKECESISGAQSELILTIARKKERYEEECEKLKNAKNQLEDLETQIASATESVRKLENERTITIRHLSDLQNEVDRLKKNTLPQIQTMVDQEEQRKNAINKEIEDAREQYKNLQDENPKLEEELRKLEESLRQDQIVYDSLTANYTKSSKELERLEQQIAELQNKNDREKLSIYRKQLEKTQGDLQQLERECEQIRQQNEQLDKALQSGQQERACLLELKRKFESGNEATEKQLRELAFAGTEEYACRVTAVCQRLELLEMVRGKMAASISKMRQTLGNIPFEGDVPLEAQLKTELRELGIRADDLRCTLLECANNLKMEEQ